MTATAPASAAPIPRTFLEYCRSFGPGIVIVLTWLGAGDVVDMATAGANYGYSLLWVFVVAVAIGVALMLRHGSGHAASSTRTRSGGDIQSAIGSASVPGTPHITASHQASGRVRFRWPYAGPEAGDVFRWRRVSGGAAVAEEHQLAAGAEGPGNEAGDLRQPFREAVIEEAAGDFDVFVQVRCDDIRHERAT